MLTLAKKTTALFIIDLQKNVLNPEPTPLGKTEIVTRAAALAHAFSNAKAPIILILTDFAPGYPDALQGIANSPWALPEEGLPAGFATLVPEIEALPAPLQITKRQMSGFFGTELNLQLRRRGCDTVVICGVATNLGIKATAQTAFDLNYNVFLAANARASVAPGLHEFAMEKILPRIARVRLNSEIISALETKAEAEHDN